jgi:protein-tyrosine phosphatase
MSPLWIQTGGPLRLAYVMRPREDKPEKDLAEMKQAGVDILVSLLEPDEAEMLGLGSEASLCEAAGISFRSFPMLDHGTPSSAAPFAHFLQGLRPELHAGRSVAAHCMASIGRSSVLLASLLIAEGFTTNEAFRMLSAARGFPVPDTQEQLRWVERFAAMQLER